jgi:hypothetical protein
VWLRVPNQRSDRSSQWVAGPRIAELQARSSASFPARYLPPCPHRPDWLRGAPARRSPRAPLYPDVPYRQPGGPDDQCCSGSGSNHVPRLMLPDRARATEAPCLSIVRVHLQGKPALRIDQLDQQRKAGAVPAVTRSTNETGPESLCELVECAVKLRRWSGQPAVRASQPEFADRDPWRSSWKPCTAPRLAQRRGGGSNGRSTTPSVMVWSPE